jgi:hypothetical protein
VRVLLAGRASGQRPGLVLRARLYLTRRALALAVMLLASCLRWRAEGRTLETMHTMKPFSSMLYDSTVFASCKILPVASSACHTATCPSELTGVDQLLLGHLPALVFLDLRLERANLLALLARCCGDARGGGLRTVSEGSASMTNLFCLRSCALVSICAEAGQYMVQRYLESNLHVGGSLSCELRMDVVG